MAGEVVFYLAGVGTERVRPGVKLQIQHFFGSEIGFNWL
jgi:hypothetical protein